MNACTATSVVQSDGPNRRTRSACAPRPGPERTTLPGSSQSLISDSNDSEFYYQYERKEAISAGIKAASIPSSSAAAKKKCWSAWM